MDQVGKRDETVKFFNNSGAGNTEKVKKWKQFPRGNRRGEREENKWKENRKRKIKKRVDVEGVYKSRQTEEKNGGRNGE